MIGNVVAKSESFTEVGPVLEVLLHPAVVGFEKLANNQHGEELVLGVGLLGENGRIRREGGSGGFQRLPGHCQGGLGHRSCCGLHATLEGVTQQKDFDKANR